MPFPRARDEKVLICVLLDGVSYDLVQKVSFLMDLLSDPRPLKTVFGYSCAAQPSILTGLMPAEHGGLCVYYRSSKSIFRWMRPLLLLPSRLKNRLLRKTIGLTRYLFGITGYFGIWEIPYELLPSFQLYEQKSFYLRHPIKGIPTILDEARDKGISVSTYYWNTPEEQIFSETEGKLVAHQGQFHFLYISKIDHILHQNGNDSGRVMDELAVYAHRIRRIHQIAKENYRKVELLVFSDHGMINVTEKIDVMANISKLHYRLGKDYIAFYDATMVRFWFGNQTCRQQIMEVMADIKGMRLLTNSELKELGSLFLDHRYGEVIYLAEGGKIISPSFFGSLNNVRGMHGYHPQEPGYEAFIASSNLDIAEAKAITDLHRIMHRSLFGIQI